MEGITNLFSSPLRNVLAFYVFLLLVFKYSITAVQQQDSLRNASVC